MIGQYLSNTNEIGTIHILQNILQLNKALVLICAQSHKKNRVCFETISSILLHKFYRTIVLQKFGVLGASLYYMLSLSPPFSS